MVGTAGFEPTDGGIKNRCLTTWRRPSLSFYSIALFLRGRGFSYKKERGFLGSDLLQVNEFVIDKAPFLHNLRTFSHLKSAL